MTQPISSINIIYEHLNNKLHCLGFNWKTAGVGSGSDTGESIESKKSKLSKKKNLGAIGSKLV
jgi:hypothetical protein